MTARAGVDLGGTKIQAVVVGPRHGVLGQARRPTPTRGGPRAVTEAIVATVREAAEQAGVEVSALQREGLGSPGDDDLEEGRVSSARNMPGWQGSDPLREEMHRR